VASGNALGLSLEAFRALAPAAREARLEAARQELRSAGADLVINSIADLVPALERATDGTA
jgi:phosphoglycolate phosphatase-like HAD superfamily hydrolase